MVGGLMEATRDGLELAVLEVNSIKVAGMVVSTYGWKRVVQSIDALDGRLLLAVLVNGTLGLGSSGRLPPPEPWPGVYAASGQASLATPWPLPLRSAPKRSAFRWRCTGSWRPRSVSFSRDTATSSLPPSW